MNTLYVQDTFTISTTIKKAPKIDGALFYKIKNHVLGKDYDLSFVFIGQKRMRRLNNTHRQKDYATDILSFTIDNENGEIFIYPKKAEQKSKDFDKTFKEYLPFLFIHGLMHLKGFEHGSIMDSEEARVRSLFRV